jgi:hypothetical protein
VKVARRVEQRTSLVGEPLSADLPATAEALREAAIGLEHAREIVDGISKIAPLASHEQCA